MQRTPSDGQVPHPVSGALETDIAPVAGKASSAVQLLQRSLDRFLAKDIQGWAQLCDVNVVVEFPFAPDAASRRTVGRAEIVEYLKNYCSLIDLRGTRKISISATDDPDHAIAQWSASGKMIGNGNPYEMSCATFATFKHGLIVNYREYWNPCAFNAALDGTLF